MSKVFLQGRFFTDGASRAIVETDAAVTKYYQSLLPKWKGFQPQLYKPHITVIRAKFEHTAQWGFLKVFNNTVVTYQYDTELKEDSTYYYLEAWSYAIGGIRALAGLPQYREGRKCYHITIGNKKG